MCCPDPESPPSEGANPSDELVLDGEAEEDEDEGLDQRAWDQQGQWQQGQWQQGQWQQGQWPQNGQWQPGTPAQSSTPAETWVPRGECGKRYVSTRIVNGQVTRLNELPFMVRFLFRAWFEEGREIQTALPCAGGDAEQREAVLRRFRHQQEAHSDCRALRAPVRNTSLYQAEDSVNIGITLYSA